MEHTIEDGPVFSRLVCKLKAGEVLRGEAGAMISMSGNVQLKAKTASKGLMGNIKAMVGGEGLFASEYSVEAGEGEVILAPPGPGDIIHHRLENQTLYAQGGAYLASAGNIEVSTEGSLRAMVSGEGLFLQKLTGTGDVWLSSYGAVYEKNLAANEEYVIDTGAMVCFESSVSYKIKTASKGLFSAFASGEGLVGRYSGPGKVWIQSRSLSALAKILIPFFPKGRS